jgi:GTPase SAR1 family protein
VLINHWNWQHLAAATLKIQKVLSMSTNDNASGGSETAATNPPSNRSAISKGKPIVIGLYGVPGCGKTFLLNQLKNVLKSEDFTFYEGSEEIAKLVPGGLKAFKDLDNNPKVAWRQRTIETIGKECDESGKVGIVTGHFMFWSDGKEFGEMVHTKGDLDTYTNIIYLQVSTNSENESR